MIRDRRKVDGAPAKDASFTSLSTLYTLAKELLRRQRYREAEEYYSLVLPPSVPVLNYRLLQRLRRRGTNCLHHG
jgi:hypothetical protein